MNAARRKIIGRAIELMSEAAVMLSGVLEDEQEAFDNMPESFQNGERGEAAQGWIDWLETTIGAAEEAADTPE